MKSKKVLLFLLIIAVGQLIFMFWNVDNAVVGSGEYELGEDVLNVDNAQLVVRFLVITFAVKIAGDFLSRFVFKFPGYDWLYIRDYLKEELFATTGIYFAFALVWLAVSFTVFYAGGVEFLSSVFMGGLPPATFYMLIGTYKFQKKESAEKRLTKKL
ncbi:MAG: hypothetical protein ACLFPS_02695 [Clostridia bacterium]